MSLSIEKFNPTVAELEALAESAKSLVIQDINDVEGINAKKAKAKELQKARTTITRIGKELREDANAFNKAVLKKEKELLEIIEPVEDDIKIELEEIEKAQEMEARRALLPLRQSEMKDMGVDVADEALLLLDATQYVEFKNIKKAEILEEKERNLNEQANAQEAERQRIENEKRIEEAKAKAAQDAVIAEQERVRLAEEKAQRDAEAEAEKLRKNQQFIFWKEKHQITDDEIANGMVKIERVGDTFHAYRKFATITIS